MTVTHVMLDLETWGTEPGCDIRSIGACVFDPVAGTIGGDIPFAHAGKGGTGPGSKNPFAFYIATNNPTGTWGRGRWRTKFTPMNHWKRKYPLTRDADTMRWWSEQSDEAQTAFTDPVDLREALGRFADWLDTATLGEGDALVPITKRTTVRLWSHGAHFDGPILAAAYRACNLPVPWHYRAPRDTRTAFDMAGIEDHSAWLNQHPGPLGVPHHALDDAICQARAVCAALAVTRRWYLTSHEGFESELNNIARDIEDEGDRAYFGSTNDADLLREIAEYKDANRFERDLSDSEQY